MSEEDNVNGLSETGEQTDSINRRRFVKALGVSGGVAASSTVFGVGTAAAKSINSDNEKPVTYAEITGAEKKRLVQLLQDSEEYNLLAEKAHSNGNQIKQGYGTIRAGRVSTSERTRELLSFELASIDTDSAHLVMARDDNSDISIAQLEYKFVDSEEFPEKTKVYYVPTDQRTTQSSESSQSSLQEKPDIKERTVTYDKSVREASQQGQIHTESRFTCYSCKTAVGLVCDIGCGAGGGFICGAVGLLSGGIGGIGCLTFVEYACFFIGEYGCGFNNIGGKVCRSNRVNLC